MQKFFRVFPLIGMMMFCMNPFLNTNAETTQEETTIKIACVGDSITLGVGSGNAATYGDNDNPSTFPAGVTEDNWNIESYPAQLSAMLGSGYTVHNYGVGSRALLQKSDHPYTETKQYQESLNWSPDIVIILLGTNDSKPINWQYKNEFLNDYKDFINSYKNLASKPTVYIALSPTAYIAEGENYAGITNTVIRNEVLPLQLEAANETGCVVIDMYTATQNMRNKYSDAVHPEKAGYTVLAKKVYNTLTLKNKVRIMALGDSITAGMNIPGGYRTELWNKLLQAELSNSIDFVGSQTDNNAPETLTDKQHEGHSGWSIAGGGSDPYANGYQWPGLTASIDQWMDTYKPSIVMLQIGSNDILHNCDMTTAPDRLSAFIDKICAKLPLDGTLYVASITPMTYSDPSFNAAVVAFNSKIPEIVQSKVESDKPVYFVDMYNELTASDIADGVHPNQNGYNKMGDAWYEVLSPILPVKRIEGNVKVNDVIKQIGEIPSSVTLDDLSKVSEARKAYDALSEAAQELITNYDVLVTKEIAIKSLSHTADSSAEIDTEVTKGTTNNPKTGACSPVLVIVLTIFTLLATMMSYYKKRVN